MITDVLRLVSRVIFYVFWQKKLYKKSIYKKTASNPPVIEWLEVVFVCYTKR